MRLVRGASGKDIGITIRAFEAPLTIPRRDLVSYSNARIPIK
jgi:hypothetical protein